MKTFDGDKKVWKNFLYEFETKLKNRLVPFVPMWLETYHLTFMTALWSFGVLFFSFVASKNGLGWMWGVSGMIVAQYITDLLDWEIGRRRNTWLIKWGYFMDHFLDYTFLCALIIGYTHIMPKVITEIGMINFDIFLLPIEINFYYFMLYVLSILWGFMVTTFLSFNATNRFQISYFWIGPTEIRIIFLLLNTALICFSEMFLYYFVPIMLILWVVLLLWFVYWVQRELWRIDMEEKKHQW